MLKDPKVTQVLQEILVHRERKENVVKMEQMGLLVKEVSQVQPEYLDLEAMMVLMEKEEYRVNQVKMVNQVELEQQEHLVSAVYLCIVLS